MLARVVVDRHLLDKLCQISISLCEKEWMIALVDLLVEGVEEDLLIPREVS